MNCSATLTAIAAQCGKTLGGIRRFFIINRDKIGAITVSEGAVTAITLAAQNPGAGDGFIGYGFKRGTANVVTTGNADDQGRNNSFTTVATLEFMKMETAKRISLQSIVETDAYAVWEDNNGKRFLMGYDMPISSNVNAETGSGYTEDNKYVLSISDSSLELPYEITMTDSAWEAILDENLE